ncbi:MAG: polysaccharide deacetylase family protein [Candidatus Sumerlaeota bacterium]|nr:polysaccharide deacetylase family protein [Candidatus Sumerlaeota bacterium]
MLKLFKIVIVLVVFALCFAGAFAGFKYYMDREGGNAFLPFLGGKAAGDDIGASGGESADGQRERGLVMASIVRDYKQAETKTPAADTGNDQPTSLTPQAAAHAATSFTMARSVRTPDPSVKLIREWPTGKNRIALTFDDGPNPKYTPVFLKLLQSKNVRATFFLLGDNIQKNPGLVRELTAQGHEVASHTWSHVKLSGLSPDKIRDELTRTASAIKESGGTDAVLLRPPYGLANKKVQDICEQMGLKIICWSVDTNDWRPQTNADTMMQEITKGARDGAIILMHDRYDKSLETTGRAIDQLRQKGFEFVTVGELLGMKQATAAAAVTTTGASAGASVPPPGVLNTPVPVPAPAMPAPAAPTGGAQNVLPEPQASGAPAAENASTESDNSGTSGTLAPLPVNPAKVTIPPGQNIRKR